MTPPRKDTLVVLIDDERDQVQWLHDDLAGELDITLVEPDGLTDDLLSRGMIFLIDMFLDEWPGREEQEPAARVFDGIALAAVIRSHARKVKRPPPVVALHTGHAGDFSDLPDEIREHALARAHNLEWVFLKQGSRSGIPTPERVLALADAQTRLPKWWPEESGDNELLRVLGAGVEELGEILDCWPPSREVGRDTAGTAVLRWLLHRILPYPCFLLDRRHVAARLGITCGSLNEAFSGGGALAEALGRCAYAGILAAFDGPRWWRSRVERMLWELSPDGALPATTDDLQHHTLLNLIPAATRNGVVALRADYTPAEEPVDVSEAVRIQLDDWPPYAEDAWAAIADAREDARLSRRVLPLDRDRL